MAEKHDIPMNAFQMVSDAPYVYVELADGSQGKIKEGDLFSSSNPQLSSSASFLRLNVLSSLN